VPGGVVVEPGLRSAVEDRLRAAYQKAGSGRLEALREAEPRLVKQDSAALAAPLRRVLEEHDALLVEQLLGTGDSPAPSGRGCLDNALATEFRRSPTRRPRRGSSRPT
jgi:hypothetical protein